MSYCILIPTVCRKDLLMKALEWYIANLRETEIIVLDNGKQGIASGHPKLKVFESAENLGVAGSWNWLINKAIDRGHTEFLLLHDDVILKRYESEIEEMIDGVKNKKYCILFPELPYHSSCFYMSRKTFEKIGQFDEAYKFYSFEISDYLYRAELKKVPIGHTDLLNPQVYQQGQSVARMPLLNLYRSNKKYYIEKWGGEAGKEKFKTPFNL